MVSVRRLATLALVSALGTALSAAVVVAPARPAAAAPSCAAFTSKVFDTLNPASGAQLLSTRADRTVAAAASGFTTVRPYSFAAAERPGTSLAAVHLLTRRVGGDDFYSLDPTEIKAAVARYGYVDQGVAFYAATTPSSCTVPVHSFAKMGAGLHRFVTGTAQRTALKAAGWTEERVRFHLGAPSLAPVVSIAVVPDTQDEVYPSSNGRYAQRVSWLLANRARLGIAYVVHTGDVVSWDTPDHGQYVRAAAGLAPLAGRIPYSLSIGNHDTAAVGIGGSAADPATTTTTVRDTRTFNRYLGRGVAALAGRFEAGKVDNQFNTFAAGGRQWMVLNLELWPRRSVVAWARAVVASHPHHNVVVATHSYLNGDGSIYRGQDYGASSPQYLYDNLVKLYPNIKVVVSGHVGTSASRVDTTPAGNVVSSFLLAMHSATTNPVRIIEMRPASNQVGSFVYAPWTRTSYPAYTVAPRSAVWVR